jgi:hypothetical protein
VVNAGGLELEVSSATADCSGATILPRSQKSSDAAHRFPCGLIQRWVRTDEIANHSPGGEGQGSLGGRPHRQRHGTLRTETDSLRSGLLARANAYCLGEHVNSDRFVSRLDFAIAAKTIEIFQECHPSRPAKAHEHSAFQHGAKASMQEDSVARANWRSAGTKFYSRQN